MNIADLVNSLVTRFVKFELGIDEIKRLSRQYNPLDAINLTIRYMADIAQLSLIYFLTQDYVKGQEPYLRSVIQMGLLYEILKIGTNFPLQELRRRHFPDGP